MKLEKLTVNSRLTEQEIKSNKEVSNEGYLFFFVCVLSICFSVAHSAPYTIKVKSDTRYGDSLIIESWDVNDSTTNPMTYQPKGSDNLRFMHYSISESGYSPGAIFVPGARKAKTMGELGGCLFPQGIWERSFQAIDLPHLVTSLVGNLGMRLPSVVVSGARFHSIRPVPMESFRKPHAGSINLLLK